ncbi:hypothetical protein NL676_012448 [Syzygium grande]|nr:hypothetical protein NL676_012448 [Syzygium grande]
MPQEGDLEELEERGAAVVDAGGAVLEDCRSMDGSPGDDRSSPCRQVYPESRSSLRERRGRDQITKGVLNGVALKDAKREEFNKIEQGHESATVEDGPWGITLDEPNYHSFMGIAQTRDLHQIRKGVLNGVALKDAKREEFNKIEQGGKFFHFDLRLHILLPSCHALLVLASLSGSLVASVHHHLHRRLNGTPFPPQKVLFSLSLVLPSSHKSLPPFSHSPPPLASGYSADSSPRTPPPPARGPAGVEFPPSTPLSPKGTHPSCD